MRARDILRRARSEIFIAFAKLPAAGIVIVEAYDARSASCLSGVMTAIDKLLLHRQRSAMSRRGRVGLARGGIDMPASRDKMSRMKRALRQAVARLC